jgi:hypothetical protein
VAALPTRGRLSVLGLLALVSATSLSAQGTAPHAFAIGTGYLRVYEGDGVALRAEYNRYLSQRIAIGFPVTLGWSNVASNPGKRRSFMAGSQVRLETSTATGRVRPYVAASALAISSSVPDYDRLQGPGPVSAHSRIGNEWGYGISLDTGLGLPVSRKLEVRLDGRVLYQRVYEGSSDVGWMVGASVLF